MQRTVARSRLRGALRIAAPLLVLFLLAGCLLPPQPVTDAGRDVFNLYIVVLILAAIVFIAVEGFILYAIVRYRRKPGDETLPEQLHGNTLIEIIWTLIPTVIVFILFGFSMVTLGEVEARQDDPGVEIQVDGFQWQWTFRYENGASETGEIGNPPTLAIPVDTPVRLVLNSLDVNHAFFVPEFLLKRDLIRMADDSDDNELRFTVTEPGTYAGQCAEFCGLSHADMTFVVEAMERADFDAYIEGLASGETPTPVPEGECGTTIQLAAVPSLQFETDRLEAPAGEPFCIEFTNNDSAPHDIGIDDIGFDGEDVPAGESITYSIPAMEPGDYTFICNIHPTMTGTITVSEQ
jgi:cytochrome c oxidase subunit II